MLLSSLLNDPNLTPEEKDYVYDMKETAILLTVLGAFILVITRFRDGWALLFCRLAFFGTIWATLKELAGLNIAESSTEYYIFSAAALLIVGYSLLTWEKLPRKT